MSEHWDIRQLRQVVEEFSALHQHVSDQRCVDLLRRCGSLGLDLVTNMLREQVNTTDETIACYCAKLIIRSRLAGRVDPILEALRLPFAKGMRHEVREVVYDWAVEDPEFLSDPRFLGITSEIASTWWNSTLERFLKKAHPRDLGLDA